MDNWTELDVIGSFLPSKAMNGKESERENWSMLPSNKVRSLTHNKIKKWFQFSKVNIFSSS